MRYSVYQKGNSPNPEPGGLLAGSLQNNSNSLQRNSNITAIEFQQLQGPAPDQHSDSV